MRRGGGRPPGAAAGDPRAPGGGAVGSRLLRRRDRGRGELRRRRAGSGRAVAPTYRFFAGKGGVGKTTCAAAAALAAAEAGRRVLAVSTDPAHSLGDAFGRRLGPEPLALPLGRGATGTLWAAEIAAEAALERWLAPRRGGLAAAIERGTYLDTADATRLVSLTPPGVDELAAVLELPRLAAATGCDEVVVDTAPTAHTLRLVAAPATLERLAAFLDGLQERDRELAAHFRPRAGAAGAPKAADRAAADRAVSDLAVSDLEATAAEVAALLRDPARTAFVWVLLPEALSVAETVDGVAALAAQGVPVAEIVVNRLTPPGGGCPLCAGRRLAEAGAIAALRRALPGRRLRFLPALPREPRGRTALRTVGRALLAPDGGARLALEGPPAPPPRPRASRRRRGRLDLELDLDLLAPPGVRLLLFGGKGGVGKTTCAAAAALALAAGAAAGRRVLLLSTDPAHSLGDVLDQPLDDSPRPIHGGPPGLRARELDAGSTFAAWRERLGEAASELAATLGGTFAEGSDLADLAPTGIDELTALATLLDALDEPQDQPPVEPDGELVVVDTAPTGHTLRLLALPAVALAWDHALLALLLKYRAAARPGPLAAGLVRLAHALRRFAALLADPRRARFVAVARPALLPRRETARLIAALGGQGIAPAALLVNAVPAPAVRSCARCAPEAAAAARELAALADLAADRCPVLSAPLAVPPPRGAEALRDWAASWRVERR